MPYWESVFQKESPHAAAAAATGPPLPLGLRETGVPLWAIPKGAALGFVSADNLLTPKTSNSS